MTRTVILPEIMCSWRLADGSPGASARMMWWPGSAADEFVVLAQQDLSDDTCGDSVLTEQAARLRARLEQPIRLDSITSGRVDVALSASIGLALGNRGDVGCDDLIHRADLAMYEAKRNRRGPGTVFAD